MREDTFLNNKNRITLASFLAYFVMSGMLAPIGIISGPMAELFDRPVTDVTAQFSWLTFGILGGAALALVIFDFLRVRTVFILVYALIIISLISLNVSDQLTLIGIALGMGGLCCGLGLASAALVISRSYEAERRASMLVITDASFSVAGFLCAAVATALVAEQFHWASTYQLVAVIALAILLLALFSRFPDTAQADTTTSTSEQWPVSVWMCIAALFLYTLGQYSLLWWLPNHVETNLGGSVEQGGRLVTSFWFGLFVAQLGVAWLVVKTGVKQLVLVCGVSTFVFSIPLWSVDNLSFLPALAFAWGVANLGLLKIVLSFATQMLRIPSPRLVSTLLLGATLGTAVSPWVTSRIVDATDSLFILQFGSVCYATLTVLLFMAVRQHASRKL